MDRSVELRTPRLRLRSLTPEDVPLVLGWARNPDVVQNFSFFEWGADPDRIRAYIEEKRRSRSDLILAVFEGESYAGNVGLHELDAVNDNARLGMILRQEAWGRGIGGEALLGLMDHAFASMGLYKLYLNVFTTNEKGIHLYEKLGFLREGVMRSEYKLRGAYRDLLRMSVLRPEWPTAAASRILGPEIGSPELPAREGSA